MIRVIIFLFVIPLFSFSQQKDYKTYDKAVKYFNSGKNEKAKELIIRILDNDMNWDRPSLLMASIFSQEGETLKAVEYLLEVYDIDNVKDIDGIQQIANLFYINGYYNEAKKYFKIAWELDSIKCKKNTSLFMKNCDFAIQKIRDPVSFKTHNMGPQINSSFAEYLPTISANNQLFFITRRLEYEDGSKNEDFFVSAKHDSAWSEATRLDRPINSPENEGAITLSSDGQLLVFTACDRRNSYGGCDLYFSIKNNRWSAPYNMGEHINSRWKDTQPCFSADGKYLYFVSNRPGGIGGLDIWRTRLMYNNYGGVLFDDPENMGRTINTEYDEMSPFIHKNNLTLYFASNGHIGMGDYDMFVSRRENVDNEWLTPINLGYPINTYKVENSLIVASDGKTAYFASDKSGFGKEDIFWFILPEEMQTDNVSELELDIITVKVGEEVILKNVQFDHNSYYLKEDAFIELHKLVAYLYKNPNLKITIEGHTDNVGSLTQNKLLSENRARSVYDYLLMKGVDKGQLVSYDGYGEGRPIADNKNDKGRALNRRTSFRIIH